MNKRAKQKVSKKFQSQHKIIAHAKKPRVNMMTYPAELKV